MNKHDWFISIGHVLERIEEQINPDRHGLNKYKGMLKPRF